MAHNIDLDRAEEIIGYQFRNRGRLREALQVATRVQEEATGETIYSHDGNRRLAQLGRKVVDLVLFDIWYATGADRGEASTIMARSSRNESLAGIAQQSGLDACTVPSVRQHNQITPPTTRKLVVAAVIAAVWLDSDKSIDTTTNVMQYLRKAHLLLLSLEVALTKVQDMLKWGHSQNGPY